MISHDFVLKELCKNVFEYCSSLKSCRSSASAVQKGLLGARKLIKEVGDKRIPADLSIYAQYLGAKVIYDDSLIIKFALEGLTIDLMQFVEENENVRQYISKENSYTYIVIIDSNLSEERKRFVIAHELGHIYLRHFDIREKTKVYLESLRLSTENDESFQIYCREKKRTDMVLRTHEIAANAFAGELLVPSPMLKHYIYNEKIRDPFVLAKIFFVSHYIVLIQMCYLNLLDIVKENHYLTGTH